MAHAHRGGLLLPQVWDPAVSAATSPDSPRERRRPTRVRRMGHQREVLGASSTNTPPHRSTSAILSRKALGTGKNKSARRRSQCFRMESGFPRAACAHLCHLGTETEARHNSPRSLLGIEAGRSMARPCTVCSHLKRAEIDEALLGRTSIRDVARQFEVGRNAVDRHRSHVGTLLAEAWPAPRQTRGGPRRRPARPGEGTHARSATGAGRCEEEAKGQEAVEAKVSKGNERELAPEEWRKFSPRY